jgi:predicted transcriptional regulator
LLKNDKDIAQVNSYAKLYAEDFYFDDKQWIYFNDLTKDIPIGKYNKDNIVLNRTKTYFEDNEFVYFINIIDFKVKDATPPLDFLKNQMKEIIVAQRMNDIREKKEVKLIQNIKKKHEITKHF